MHINTSSIKKTGSHHGLARLNQAPREMHCVGSASLHPATKTKRRKTKNRPVDDWGGYAGGAGHGRYSLNSGREILALKSSQ
ncbi:hypothetical protein [Bordetella sp. BOR01]|uniref:hypothetical protein n=1 Tax=Bordetella sp. BOR01 TaxID=2854779 RepID=UPI001C463364|nr:hypothetical protein [Bordetella sp. BOR01]MBV7485598.1 hypothetical protein [Bordetella sp. BOR01]